MIFIYSSGIQAPGNSDLQVEHFTFSPSIADYIREASLVISHAGDDQISIMDFLLRKRK
jgi:beta-1,4-N-acetylglucosaminyltransferase